MSGKKKEISHTLDEQLRAVSFSTPKVPDAITNVHTEEVGEETPPVEPSMPTPQPFSVNKRVVTLEYLDKFEQASKASAQYECIKDFSHTISNLSIILLSVSIIIYLGFFFISPGSITLVSLLILFLQAFTLLGLTLYTMSKASTSKQIRDIIVSDFSTVSQVIGNPRADAYIPMDTLNTPD